MPNTPAIFPEPVYAEALTFASAFRCSNRRCFLSRTTLKRSKSDSSFRRACWSRFLAQLVSFHLASTPAFSHAALTVPDLAPRGSFSMVI